ncbi:hypothetical protein [Henriciella litoralis]|uniref:hypothetical protein n=1 Tax=Henriciella litoralis TaxID=568102 RepID=UPI00111C567F|nr:hypothetical protein [Henriciella litoralis]
MFKSMMGLAALAGLGACNLNPMQMVGGPCRYETSIVEAKVVEQVEHGVVVDTPEGHLYVSFDDLTDRPATGETVRLERKRILEGTCTPDIVRQVG